MKPDGGLIQKTERTDDVELCFDDFRLDLQLRSLHRGSEKVKLTPKPFATLEFLVMNRRRVVSKAELMEKIWGGQREASTVEHAVGQLRRALGDDVEKARYIETVPGEGYRFGVEVHPLAARAALEVARLREHPTGKPDEAPRPTQASAADGSGRVTGYGRLLRRRVLIPVVLVCLGVAVAAIVYTVAPSRIARTAWNGNTLMAISDSGGVLWRHSFDVPLWEPPPEELSWRSQVVDLNGNGSLEVLMVVSLSAPGSDGHEEIYCFSSRGRVLWRYKPEVDMAFNGDDFNGPWRFTHLLVVPGNRSGSIWAAVVHDVWWPSFVMRMSNTGAPSRVFTNSGDILELRRVQMKGGSYIFAAGVNNEYRQASLAILSENGTPATSPQTEGSKYQCIRGCPTGRSYRYILFPRSELNVASDEPYNFATHIHARPGGVTVETLELATGVNAFYDFSQDLRPERVSYGENYSEIHRRFEREGRIHHGFKDCPERKIPAVLKMCDDHGIWSTVVVPRVPYHD